LTFVGGKRAYILSSCGIPARLDYIFSFFARSALASIELILSFIGLRREKSDR
jgi:hypothetical protein